MLHLKLLSSFNLHFREVSLKVKSEGLTGHTSRVVLGEYQEASRRERGNEGILSSDLRQVVVVYRQSRSRI